MTHPLLLSIARKFPPTARLIERSEELNKENRSLKRELEKERSKPPKVVTKTIEVPSAPVPAPQVDQVDRLLQRMKDLRQELPSISEIQSYNPSSRDAWVKAQAKSLPAGTKLLDVGAGTCPYKADFAHCEYKSHDFKQYEGYIDADRKEGVYGELDYVSDILSLPVPDGSFDVVLCTEVLEHVPEPGPAMVEMARVLRPGGVMIVTAPLGSGLHQEPYHFYGGYTPHFYRHFAEKGGMRIDSIEENGGFFKLLSQECSRVAWTMDKHRNFHDGMADAVGELFGDLLPRYLYRLEKDCFIPQLTVGYHVRATKL